MGFGVVVMPIFFIQFLFGLILMLVFWFIEYRKDLKYQISFLENESKIKIQQKDFEIENLKTKKTQHIDMKDKSDSKIKPVSFATTNKLVEK